VERSHQILFFYAFVLQLRARAGQTGRRTDKTRNVALLGRPHNNNIMLLPTTVGITTINKRTVNAWNYLPAEVVDFQITKLVRENHQARRFVHISEIFQRTAFRRHFFVVVIRLDVVWAA